MPNKIIFALCTSILLLPFASCRRGTVARSDEVPVFSCPALQESVANFVRAVGEIDNPYEVKTITNVLVYTGEVDENVVDTLIEIEAAGSVAPVRTNDRGDRARVLQRCLQ